jgi:two-component system LytT family response regulator
MKVIIVDDEALSRQTIELILTENFPKINIVGQADSVKSALEIIKKQNPDLVFLDIDLTDGSGFDILSALATIKFKVIFITAHQEFAIRAIKFSAFDYILKPISSSELVNTITRVQLDAESKSHQVEWDAFFNNISKNEGKEKKIVLKTSESIHLVQISDIVRIEADNNYSTFFLVGGEKILISKGLKEYEELLTSFGFFRVHQSHLINLNYILRFDKKEGGFVVLTDKSHVPVSQRKKQKLFDFFENISG